MSITQIGGITAAPWRGWAQGNAGGATGKGGFNGFGNALGSLVFGLVVRFWEVFERVGEQWEIVYDRLLFSLWEIVSICVYGDCLCGSLSRKLFLERVTWMGNSVYV